ncbi:hypothetical protein PCH_Pc21g22930 [Penicillium rubens Wisconsin 54-1255]|uniref:Uncharacterized protein n=1 Tax=Penicillium rubens (strain ATCC 28089 / DSM 1075 / NRRL 1951 / Wisconsin 54-1255) TaxID=500485 RepID=B6HHU5_PENRW|nr:hypothetical protein PCH_Pc21g22930 [Penicillium rubens Wisconsin 54-1255]
MADTVRFSSKKGNATGIGGVVRDTGLGLGEYNHMIFNDPSRVSSGNPRSGMHRYLPLLLPLSDCDSEVVVFELGGFPISMDEFKATYYRASAELAANTVKVDLTDEKIYLNYPEQNYQYRSR